ncbi:UNVERIFIED_ORG: sugar transport protein [Nocardia globerula]|uniref:Putative proline/betaine transporter n=1 Tax=Nocardia globerula TaxID=1818 RepID=A0A652YX04_NOCGL
MTTVSPAGGSSAAGTAAAPAKTTSVRRVAIASCIGTTIEFYDFFIYGTAAALVFPTVFFPALGATAGTVASFATFAVAFIARPVGAMLFGHFGDRIGRKKTLISTLLLMGISTLLIGLLPGADTIGVAAPIILVLLRFGQGFAVGGEWAGATLLTAEYAPPGKRGLYAMFPQLGPAIAFVLSSSTFLITGAVLGDTNQAFLDYGWRIPFLFSIVLVGIGLYMRLAIEETPVFKAEQADRVAAEKNEAPPAPSRSWMHGVFRPRKFSSRPVRWPACLPSSIWVRHSSRATAPRRSDSPARSSCPSVLRPPLSSAPRSSSPRCTRTGSDVARSS